MSMACAIGVRPRDAVPRALLRDDDDAPRLLPVDFAAPRDRDALPCAPRRCAALAPPFAPARRFAEDLLRLALFEDLLRLRVVAMT
jgi:hypothetical protein